MELKIKDNVAKCAEKEKMNNEKNDKICIDNGGYWKFKFMFIYVSL